MITIEQAYIEACTALGETIVRERTLSRTLEMQAQQEHAKRERLEERKRLRREKLAQQAEETGVHVDDVTTAYHPIEEVGTE